MEAIKELLELLESLKDQIKSVMHAERKGLRNMLLRGAMECIEHIKDALLSAEPKPCRFCGGRGRLPSHDGIPCKSHPACQSHTSHPCEGCGRLWPVVDVPCKICLPVPCLPQPACTDSEFVMSLEMLKTCEIEYKKHITDNATIKIESMPEVTDFHCKGLHVYGFWQIAFVAGLESHNPILSKLEADKAELRKVVEKGCYNAHRRPKQCPISDKTKLAQQAETIRKQAKQIERLVEGLYSVRRSTGIMEARRFAEEALKKE